MEQYKQEFIDFIVRADVLAFGDFVTKSGRSTPYFLNMGNCRTGAQIARLGEFYARAIQANIGSEIDVLFGPAYKGIPLAVTTAMALAAQGQRDVSFCFNRKETKDHGEGGSLVGHKLHNGDRVVIVEDVTTAGTSIRETVPILRAVADIELMGLVVAVDRMEKGRGEKGALPELQEEFCMTTCAIVTLKEIVEHLHGRRIDGRVVLDDETMGRIAAYQAEYGVVQP